MHLAIYLNKKEYQKYRKIVKQLKTTDGKLLKTLTKLLLENPNQYTPNLEAILSASTKQQHPHSKP